MKVKGKITITITLGLVCLIFTLVMFMRFKTVQQVDLTSIENMREDELRTEIANWKTKFEETEKKLEEVTVKINEYELTMENNQEAKELLRAEVVQANNILGKNAVSGLGIIVTLSDKGEKEIEARNLSKLVNELRLAGAEAISINEQRIVSMSDIAGITSSEYSFINVNGQRLIGPYVVKAIGDVSYLESGITNKQYGYIEKYAKSEGIDVSVETNKNITIPAYSKEFKFEYLTND